MVKGGNQNGIMFQDGQISQFGKQRKSQDNSENMFAGVHDNHRHSVMNSHYKDNRLLAPINRHQRLLNE